MTATIMNQSVSIEIFAPGAEAHKPFPSYAALKHRSSKGATAARLLVRRSAFRFRTVLNLAAHQKQEQYSEHHVHSHEAQQGKHPVAC